jgi:hypothetical protein
MPALRRKMHTRPGKAGLVGLSLWSDAKQDNSGNYIQQGIGAWPHNLAENHFSAIRKWEGEAKFQAALKRIWKDNPDRARKIGLLALKGSAHDYCKTNIRQQCCKGRGRCRLYRLRRKQRRRADLRQ